VSRAAGGKAGVIGEFAGGRVSHGKISGLHSRDEAMYGWSINFDCCRGDEAERRLGLLGAGMGGTAALLSEREKYTEGSSGRAVIGMVQMDTAAMPVYDLPDDPEAEAGTNVGFRGEEWLEDLVTKLVRYSWAIILDDDLRGLNTVVFDAEYLDAHGAVLREGVDGVGDEVGDNLLQLSGAAIDGWTVAKVAFDVDVLRSEFIGIDVEHRLDERSNVNRVARAGLAVEAEGLAGDVCDAVEFLLCEREVVEGGLRKLRRRLCKVEQVSN
jgi:hypothetical protein